MPTFGITTVESGLVVDTRWRISKHGEGSVRPGQLDVDTFTSVVGLVNEGYIPSGTAVSRNASTGLYELFVADEGQGVDGFVYDNDGVLAEDGATCGIFVHGIIKPTDLPVAAQRTSVPAATTGVGSFVYVAE